jgi:hypothetical protein
MEPSTLEEAGDYRWSLSITKEDWVTLVGKLAAALNYSNFKDAVHERKDQRSKAAAYLEIWRVMRQVEFDDDERGARRSPAKRKVGILASPRKKQEPKKAEKKGADVKVPLRAGATQEEAGSGDVPSVASFGSAAGE